MGRRLEEYTREELLEYVKTLKKQKKFGLVWEDKPERVVKECETKFPVVREVEEKAIENAPGEPTNIIIEGDNYHALSVLNYTHAGKVDVIYIDPPYNTGNKDFIYNDCYVDKEDTFRHSKWLSFMDKRLRLAKNLLKDDGVIFISIDDNEQANLKILCDEIFGVQNFVSNMVWAGNRTGKNDSVNIKNIHEYILVYFKTSDGVLQGIKDIDESKYKFSDEYVDERGKYYLITLDQAALGYVESLDFGIEDPETGELVFPNGRKEKSKGEDEHRWRWGKEKVKNGLENGLIVFKNSAGKRRVYTKQYQFYNSEGAKIDRTILKESVISEYSTRGGKDLLKELFGYAPFSYAKPMNLLKDLIAIFPNKQAVVLDFFAGSGTTGQAVMELNKEDDGHRQFILVTNNEASGKADAGAEGIAEKVTYPRIKTVITGIRPDGTKYSDGIPANLRYFKTDFVEKGATTDDTREALITECSDMIRIRENAFDFVASAPEYRFYKNDKVFVPIIFDQFAIAETWEKVEELNTDKLPVHCYNFSYNRHANEEEIPEDTKLEWTACSIPESVLEVYRKIFRKKEA
ncbi:site-specific DNA-methyltransferase [Candidatus Saccharibacteria bacterium]|nr:site-specific DNA-methyltransferase [Candidatus Saccharibacteria bacterium]